MKQRVILHADLLQLMTKHRIAVPMKLRRSPSSAELFVCAYDLDALLQDCYDDGVCYKVDLEGGERE